MSSSGKAGATLTDQSLGTIAADQPRFTAGNTDAQALAAACSSATTLGIPTVTLSGRTWNVGAGFSMSGYTCALVGSGSGAPHPTNTEPNGTVLYAPNQSGPVLNLTGWKCPANFTGKLPFGGFSVKGSGAADPTQANAGMKNSGAAIGSVHFFDIYATDTGGPGFDLFDLYLCTVSGFVTTPPAGAQSNNVPYMVFRGCNGTNFKDIGFRSLLSSGDTGSGGALLITDDGTSASGGNTWDTVWFEYLHVPTNGTLINNAANSQLFLNTYFVDCSAESGSSNTAFITFNPSAKTDFGGNIWLGVVPGNQSSTTGILLNQSRNTIQGPKGYNGGNVTLASGVGYTTAIISGSISGGAAAAFVDNSGQTTNTLIDNVTQTARYGNYSVAPNSTAGAPGPRFTDPTTPTNGAVALGTGGTRIQTVGTTGYFTVDALTFRNVALTGFPSFTLGPGAAPRLMVGAGAPTVSAPVGSVYLRTDGGAGSTLYVNETGTTSWTAK